MPHPVDTALARVQDALEAVAGAAVVPGPRGEVACIRMALGDLEAAHGVAVASAGTCAGTRLAELVSEVMDLIMHRGYR